MYNTSFVKYFYLMVLLVPVLTALFNGITEQIGFLFLSGVVSLFVVFFLFDFFKDSAREFKLLRIVIPETRFTEKDYFDIPLYMIIFAIMTKTFIGSIYMSITTTFLEKKYGNVKLGRKDRKRMSMFKFLFFVALFALFGLTYSYCMDFQHVDFTRFSGYYKTWILLLTILGLSLSLGSLLISQDLSQLRTNTTE